MPGERDAELGIVVASDVSRPIAKIPRDDRCEFCLSAPRDALRIHPGDQNERSGLERPGWATSRGVTV
jgi:hypothetical protein